MGKVRYIIIKEKASEDPGTYNEEGKYEFWRDPNYHEYEEKNGEHFSSKLADFAVKQMKNNEHGYPGHSWSVEDVKNAFEKLGLKKPSETTWGDIAYSANMAYADYFGILFKTEAECIKYAYADAIDPDGYPGKIFNRWLSDIMGKNTPIEWNKYIE